MDSDIPNNLLPLKQNENKPSQIIELSAVKHVFTHC